MKLYQLNYLYSSLVNLEVVEDFISKTKVVIEKKAGSIHQSSIPNKEKLGSPINRCQFAYLGTIEFDLEPNEINKLIEQLKSDQNLWRFMLLKRKRLFSQTLPLNDSLHQNKETFRDSLSQVNQTLIKEQVAPKVKKTKRNIKNGSAETTKTTKKHSSNEEASIKSVPKIKKSLKTKISEIDKKLSEILD